MAHRIGHYGLSMAAVLAAAPLPSAQAQVRDLDSETSVGDVFVGEVPAGGEASFALTLAPGQAIDLTAAPVGGSDPPRTSGSTRSAANASASKSPMRRSKAATQRCAST